MISEFLIIASGLISSTYGWLELKCGHKDDPKPCSRGAITASGIEFNPELPQAAIALPDNYRIRAKFIKLRTETGTCTTIHLIDKLNPRYVGKRGFDLTPAALTALGIKAHRNWTGKIYVCNI